MGSALEPSRAIVVGIDGSRVAVNAALWAIDEAVTRDIPLRLVAVFQSHYSAERVLRTAVAVVEATDRPVKIDVEVAHGRPATVLRELSCSAEMVVLGIRGIGQSCGLHVGSTAAAVAGSAHCPVAIIGEPAVDPRFIVAEIDELVGATVLLTNAVAEAQLRGLPLLVVAANPDFRQARLDRIVAQYRNMHPDLDIQVGISSEHLEGHARSVELLVTNRRFTRDMRSVLVCPSSRAL